VQDRASLKAIFLKVINSPRQPQQQEEAEEEKKLTDFLPLLIIVRVN